MTEQERIDWIQLINTENIGAVSFANYLKKYGSAAAALKTLPQEKLFSRRDAEYELEKAHKLGITVLCCVDAAYPKALLNLHDAPPVLYAKGRLDILNAPNMVSIVGARNASVNGRKTASRIAFDLTQNDIVVVSGMARGIDTAAHLGAMYAKNQQGPTIAVLGCGVDVVYPKENTAVYEQICAQGVILSEFLIGTEPQSTYFPRRNRLVAGLSAGTLVVEASLNSGSLITARLALEQGKEVFAVPCSPTEGRGAGCNNLIREGANLAESAEDILEVLRFHQTRVIKPQAQNLYTKPLDKVQKSADIPMQKSTPSSEPLINLISPEGIETDELIRQSKQSAQEVLMKLTELELDGLIMRKGSLILPALKQNRKRQ